MTSFRKKARRLRKKIEWWGQILAVLEPEAKCPKDEPPPAKVTHNCDAVYPWAFGNIPAWWRYCPRCGVKLEA